ncbi:MAG: glycosyltransferase family 2 protein, partial [Candidatus Kapabacteria bacterium]|nr:glycosyltransferase family 2 protein [Candidatus Kapabacteria bacterium]
MPVLGKPMIQVVINNLRPKAPHRFIFICLQEHMEKYNVADKLKTWAGEGTEVVTVNQVTEGAACTVLLAKDFINNDNPMMIANSDQWVDIDINQYLATMDAKNADGMIMTMWADDPKWSFVRFNEHQEIVEVVEKQVVSNEATVGIYNFKRGMDFVNAAERMIAKNFRVNGEFYVAPAYNEMIAEGKKLV